MFLKTRSTLMIMVILSSPLFAEGFQPLGNNATVDDIMRGWGMGMTKKTRSMSIPSRTKSMTMTEEKTRAISFDSKPTIQAIKKFTTSATCPVHNKVISLNINFKNNEYLLNRNSFSIVSKVATAINDQRLTGCSLLIEGHTNSVGSAKSNLKLSKERAKTVAMLLSSMNIDHARLNIVGKGESELLYPRNGRSAANRRVQFRILDSTKM